MNPLLTANAFDDIKEHGSCAHETTAEGATDFSRADETTAEGAGAFRPLNFGTVTTWPLGPDALKGHGFSRAGQAPPELKGTGFSPYIRHPKDRGALAPEESFPGDSVFALRPNERGLTLVELMVTVFILTILASAALPLVRFQVKRQQERELRFDLWEMRDAIDKYKDAADRGAFQTKVESQNYPPDLETLVNGVDVQGKKLKFLRKIPIDPMTHQTDWGMRSMQDDPDSDSFGGQSVFDVYSKSQGTGLDGTKYSTW
jgi:general secretion pathway protein G